VKQEPAQSVISPLVSLALDGVTLGDLPPHRTNQSLYQQVVNRLQHTTGNQSVIRQIQRAPEAGGRPAAPGGQPANPARPRRDYVFILGSGGFFTGAYRYFQGYAPNATFIRSKRSLTAVLAWVRDNVSEPIGNLYIVSHGNEDGTLTFGGGRRLSVSDLRSQLHPGNGVVSTLPELTNQVDAQTRIHIKGCNIGRNQVMVELIDEAFGGAGTVTAPTHEQEYGYDLRLERKAMRRASAAVRARHPLPPPVDPHLRGSARRQALRRRRQALRQRQRAITAELKVIGRRASTHEALSGPMFQRPGTQLYTADELAPEVNRLYSHLTQAQRRSLVRRLVAADRRSARVAYRKKTIGQHGQRAYQETVIRPSTFDDPQNEAEALRLVRRRLPRRLGNLLTQFTGRLLVVTYTRGRRHYRYEAHFPDVPDEAALRQRGRGYLPNPDRYTIRVIRQRRNGRTRLRVVAERVVAYIHHGSLNVSPREYFRPPMTNREFYARSTYTPPRRRQARP
jgi:hypothetical protein